MGKMDILQQQLAHIVGVTFLGSGYPSIREEAGDAVALVYMLDKSKLYFALRNKELRSEARKLRNQWKEVRPEWAYFIDEKED